MDRMVSGNPATDLGSPGEDDDREDTVLHPGPGVFGSLAEALAAYVSDAEGWERHRIGFIVLHEVCCESQYRDEQEDCSCTPTIVAPAGRPH
jgi:hypothetical protein